MRESIHRFIQQVAQCRERLPSIGRKALVILLVLSLVGVPVAGQVINEVIEYNSEPATWQYSESGGTLVDGNARHAVEPLDANANAEYQFDGSMSGSESADGEKYVRLGNYSGDITLIEIEWRYGTGVNFARDDSIVVRVGSDEQTTGTISASFYENTNELNPVVRYLPGSNEWYIRIEDGNGNLVDPNAEFTFQDNGITPADITGIGYGFSSVDSDSTFGIQVDGSNSRVEIQGDGQTYYVDSITGVSDYEATPTPTPTATATPYPDDQRLEFNVRNFMQPGDVAEFGVYYFPGDGTERGDGYEVTLNDSTTYDIENVTVNGTQALTIDSTGYRFEAVNNSSAAVQVNVTATHDAGTETLNQTKQITIAQPSVENLEIIPGFLNRLWALFDDPTIFALLIAGFLSVPAARFTNAFGGLATAQMVVTIGWLAGYIGTGIAMLSVFVALFIGLNIAENVQLQSGGNFGGGFR